MLRKNAYLGLVAGVAAMAAAPTLAQDYPNDTITVVVAYPPGGFNDTVARLIAEDLSESLGVTTVVDNRP